MPKFRSTQQAVVALDARSGEIISRYVSAHEAARQLCCNPSSIVKCCRGALKQTQGYVFMYDYDYYHHVREYANPYARKEKAAADLTDTVFVGGDLSKLKTRPVSAYTQAGKYLCSFKSAAYAVIGLPMLLDGVSKAPPLTVLSEQGIRSVCNGYAKTCSGLRFAYASVDENNSVIEDSAPYSRAAQFLPTRADERREIFEHRPVEQYTKDNQFVSYFDSIRSAALELGGKKPMTILEALCGDRRYAYGYVWKWSEDDSHD